jgi:sigma-B regulation protein RsbU (phosphoserine phosphatase)
MKILVVDDDRVCRLIITKLLTDMGHECAGAADGKEAWGLLQKQYYPCVVSDWTMPEMDGLDLCRHIRKGKWGRYTYVILLTARTGKKDYKEGMEAGADDFLFKPCDENQLFMRVRVAERILGLRDHVERLEGLLSICSYCKKIRDDKGAWKSIEDYVEARTCVEFTHGICPECYQSYVQTELDSLHKK